MCIIYIYIYICTCVMMIIMIITTNNASNIIYTNKKLTNKYNQANHKQPNQEHHKQINTNTTQS